MDMIEGGRMGGWVDWIGTVNNMISPRVEVLDADIVVRGRLPLTPQKQPFLGRGFCGWTR